MAGQIKWTKIAWRDLESVAEYIAKDSRHYSAAIVREIRDASRSLSVFPERGRIVPELNDPNLRELLVRTYRLIYKIEADQVYIVALVHGARDLPTLWEIEGR